MNVSYDNQIISKGRAKLIKTATNAKFSPEELFIIERAELPLDKLQICFDYMNSLNRKGYDKSMLAAEVKKCLTLFRENLDYPPSSGMHNFRLRHYLLPMCYSPDKEDVLFGSNKKKTIANINFAAKDGGDEMNLFLLKLLNSEIPSDIIKLLVEAYKNIYHKNNLTYFNPNVPLEYEFLYNDLKQNKDNSFLYKCIINHISLSPYNLNKLNTLLKFNQSLIAENRVYDVIQPILVAFADTLVTPNFDGISHSLNDDKLEKLLTSQNKIFAALQQICSNPLKDYYQQNGLDDRCVKFAEKLEGVNATIQIPYNYFSISCSNGFINLCMKHYPYTKIVFDKNKPEFYGYTYKDQSLHISIFPDGTFFERKDKKILPLCMKRIHQFYQLDSIFKDLITNLFAYFKSDYPIIQDVLAELNHKAWYLPVTLNEILTYHNKKELFLKKYKVAAGIRTDFNKLSFNLAYLIVKSYLYVSEDSKGVLQNIKDEKLIDNCYCTRFKDNVVSFLAGFYQNKGILVDDDDYILEDYLRMCMDTKNKISLRFSEKRIAEEHDRLAIEGYKKKTKPVKVPKQSKFNNLQKILPADFEWIKSRRRLMKEASTQKHCVWSYSDKINQDKCAIYSYVDTTGAYTDDWHGRPERYTIEFAFHNNKYRIIQIQGKCNKKYTSKMQEYVTSLLENSSIDK